MEVAELEAKPLLLPPPPFLQVLGRLQRRRHCGWPLRPARRRPEDEHRHRPALHSLRTHLASRREALVGVWVEGGSPLGAGAYDAEQFAKREDVPRHRAFCASRCAGRRRLRRSRDSDGVELEPQALQAGPVARTLLGKGMQEDKHAVWVRLATT